LQVTAINALRGLSDVRVPAFIAIFAYWVIAVPLGYFLGFPLKLGATGVWVGLAAGLGCAAFFLLLRFYVKTRSLAQTL
jgi:multidrug resistance protein, MATE family